MALRPISRWGSLVNRWFAPLYYEPMSDSEILVALNAIAPTGRRYSCRPMLSQTLRLPIWFPSWVRITKRISVDLRTVDATGVNTGTPGAVTWAYLKSLETLYTAPLTLYINPYFFGGYTNTDPTVTNGGGGQSDAAHLALIQGYVDIVKNTYVTGLGGSVALIMVDEGRFDGRPNDAGNAAWNTAQVAKYQAVYDIFVTAFPAATQTWFGMGAMWPDASDNAQTFSAAGGAGTGNFGGPYPQGRRWGLPPWNINHFDEADTVEAYTVGTVTPFIEVVGNTKLAVGPILYTPQYYHSVREAMYRSDMLYNASGIWAALSRPLVPWLTMGAGRSTVGQIAIEPTGTAATYEALDYPVDISWWYGAIMDNAFGTDYMPAPSEVVLWEAPSNPDYPGYMHHAIAFFKGCNGIDLE